MSQVLHKVISGVSALPPLVLWRGGDQTFSGWIFKRLGSQPGPYSEAYSDVKTHVEPFAIETELKSQEKALRMIRCHSRLAD